MGIQDITQNNISASDKVSQGITNQQTLETLLQEVKRDGIITKEEIELILSRMSHEKADIQNETLQALNTLKEEGLQDILSSGLSLKKGDNLIIEALNKYTVSDDIKKKFAALKDGESFVVTLEGTNVVVVDLNNPLNDDSASIRNVKESRVSSGKSEEKSLTPDDIIAINNAKDIAKKAEVDAFASAKTLAEMQGANDASIASTTKLLEEKKQTLGDTLADKGVRATINNLLSSYKDVKILLEALRKSSKTVSESQQKQNEVDMYQNNIYKLNQKAEDLLGQKSSEGSVVPSEKIVPLQQSTPTATVLVEKAESEPEKQDIEKTLQELTKGLKVPEGY